VSILQVLFAHDHVFYKYDGEYYSNGAFSSEVLTRYTNAFGKIRFVSRQRSIDSIESKMTKASADNVEFVPVPNFNSVIKYGNILKAKRIIMKEVMSVDVVIARLPSSIGSLAVKYAKKYNKHYVVEVVGSAWDALWNHGSIQGKIYAPIAYNKMKRLVKSSKYTLYVTNEFLQEKYPSSGITVGCSNVNIPQQVDDDVLKKRISRIMNKKKNDIIKIGMIGALGSSYKGFDLAIEAISFLEQKFDNIELFIVGAGIKDKWVDFSEKKKIASRIHFLGSLPNGNEIFNWLDNIDIYIQPSRTEGLPRATIEAMSRGCPIVGSIAGGIPELIDSRLVHQIGDSQDLANKIECLITDNMLLKDQAKINFEKSKQYTKDILDNRRNEFWNTVKSSVAVEKSKNSNRQYYN
jgi:glycosyltransferase involved in cell wall biosynthesis